jgi:general secretion pathway protein K
MNVHPVTKQHGMALVLVLWLVVLLSVIATGHSRNTHIETRLAARHVDTSTSRHVAEAVIQLAILDLLLADGEQPVDTSGRARPVQVLGRNATISIRRASGFIDLNKADDTVLQALFLAGGANDAQALQLAHAVVDWRDSDDLLHMHGAEDDDYRSAGIQWTSRDADFERIEELQYVFGMTGNVYRAVLPYVTVYSGQSAFDIEAAPEFLINALTGSALAMNSASTRNDIGTGNYHIAVSIPGANSTLVSIEAVVNISGSREEPYRLLEWREPARSAPAIDEEPPA